MKKKFLTVVIVLLAVLVFTVLFVPRTTRVTAKLENDNAQILQVDIKSKDFLFLEDKATGSVLLTANAELRSYEYLNPVTDPNGSKAEAEYPMYMPMWRYDSNSDQLIPAMIFFDKKCSCFILLEGNDRYYFAAEDADEKTMEVMKDFVN